MDCSLPGSSIPGILEARMLEWVAIPFSSGSFWPKVWTHSSWITGRFFTIWASWEAFQWYAGFYLEPFFFFFFFWILSYIEMKHPWVYMRSPSQYPLPPPSPPAPSRFSQCTRSECLSHASNLVICFTRDNIQVSLLFSWNIPPLPSPTESKRLFYKSVSFFVSVLHIGISLTSF